MVRGLVEEEHRRLDEQRAAQGDCKKKQGMENTEQRRKKREIRKGDIRTNREIRDGDIENGKEKKKEIKRETGGKNRGRYKRGQRK